jgi:histone H3/H4
MPTFANTVTINATANTAQAVGNLNQVGTAVNNVGNQIQTVGTRTNSATHGILGMNSAVRDVAVSFVSWQAAMATKNEVSAIMKIAGDVERLRESLVFFTNGEQGDETIKWLEQLGNQSFGLTALEKSFVKLRAVGIEPTQRQLEGMVSYMFRVGRTDVHDFGETIGKMSQLFQLGAVGIDDALKELNEKLPFTMDALAEKLGMITGKSSPDDIQREFKKRNMDFSTIITSIFEYLDRHYADSLQDTQRYWDSMVAIGKAKMEYLRKEVGSSGFFDEIRKIFSNLLSEFDQLEKDGTISRWMKSIGEDVTSLIKAFGLNDVSIKGFGDGIVETTAHLRTMEPTINRVSDSVKQLTEVLGKIVDIFNSLPTFMGDAITYGLLGKMLFGTSAGLTIGAMTGAIELSNRLEKMAGTDKMRREYGYKGIDDPKTVETMKRQSQFWSDRFGAASELLTGWKKSSEFAWAMSPEEIKKEGENIGDQLNAVLYSEKYIDGMVRKSAASPFDNPAGHSTSIPGEMMFKNRIHDMGLKYKTMFDNMMEDVQKSGLHGVDLALENAKIDFNRMWSSIDEMTPDAIALSNLYKNAGQMDRANKVLEEHFEKYNALKALFSERNQKLIADDAVKQAQKDDKRTVGKEDVDQFLANMEQSAYDYSARVSGFTMELEALNAEMLGDTVLAAKIRIQKETDETIAQLDRDSMRLGKELTEFYEKVYSKDKIASGEAVDAYEAAKYAKESAERDIGEMIELEKAKGKLRSYQVEWQTRNQEEVGLAQLKVDYSELTGIIEDQTFARVELLKVQERSAWLNAKSDDERKLVEIIYNERIRLEQLKEAGSFYDGWTEGLRQIKNDMPTAFTQGQDAVGMLKKAFDSLGDTITEVAMTGKIDMTDMANSIIKDMIRMMVQTLVVNRLMSSVFGLFGVTGGGPAGAAIAGLGGLSGIGNKAITPSSAALPSVTVHVNHTGRGSYDMQSARDVGTEVARVVRSEIDKHLQKHMRPGGMLNRGF